MVERFVFGDDDIAERISHVTELERELLQQNMRKPLPVFWMETGHYGWLFDGDAIVAFGRTSAGIVQSIGGVSFSALSDLNGEVFVHYPNSLPRPVYTDHHRFAMLAMAVVPILLALINSPRSVTRERVRPAHLSSEQRLARQHRSQRGYPMYSFNRVTLKRPDNSLQSSDVLMCGAQTSKRGHWVIGHWRLIDGAAEPYWTWVDAHKRGDEEMGFVAHERHIKIAPGSFGARRGFVIPTVLGEAGGRLPASPA